MAQRAVYGTALPFLPARPVAPNTRYIIDATSFALMASLLLLLY
jgi:hypothetical protein